MAATWTPRTVELPPATNEASITWDPSRRTAWLAVHDSERRPHGDARGHTQLWEWGGERWTPSVRDLFPGDTQAPPLAWFDAKAADLVIARVLVERGTPKKRRLVWLRLGARDEIRSAPLELPEDAWPAHAEAIADPRGGALLVLGGHNESISFRFDGEHVHRVCTSPYLVGVAGKPLGGRIAGLDVSGNVYTFERDSWRPLPVPVIPYTSSGLAFDPELGLIRLIANREGGMSLYRLGERGWELVKPVRQVARVLASPILGVDATRKHVLAFGGQDFDRSLALTNETWVSSGGDFRSALGDAPLPWARYNTACVARTRLLMFNHSTVEMRAREPGGWRVVVVAPENRERQYERFDDRMQNATAWEERAWILDGTGAVWEGAVGAAFRVRGDSGVGPGGHYSQRTAIAWDPVHERLVVFGGPNRNDTWVFRKWRWSPLEGRPRKGTKKAAAMGRPDHGVGFAATTPHGVYLLVGAGLWKLAEKQWELVGGNDAWKRRALCHLQYEPKRNLLLAADSKSVCVLRGGDFVPVIALPEGTGPRRDFTGGDWEIAVDPLADELLLLGGTQQLGVPLAELALEGDAPPVEVRGTAAPRGPKREWIRPAARLVPSRTKVKASLRSLGVVAGSRAQLVAVLPNVAPLDVPGISAIAVTLDEAWWEEKAKQPWLLGGGGVGVHLLPQRKEPPPPALAARDGLVRAKLEPFEEIDPAHENEVDTPTGTKRSASFSTKIGGWPRFIQDALSGTCDRCESELRFAAELASDVFDSRFGDVGSLYVFVCPKGCQGKGALQSH